MLSLVMGCKSTTAKVSWRTCHVNAAAVCLLTAFLAFASSSSSFSQTPDKAPGSSSPPAAAAQERSGRQGDAAQQSAPSAAPISPREQLSKDCATLLKLAKELKVEMKKAGPDTLSLQVIRKTEVIQKLAHKIREEMKQLKEKK